MLNGIGRGLCKRCTEKISEWRATGGVEGREKGVTLSLEVLALPRIGFEYCWCDNVDGAAIAFIPSRLPNSLRFARVGRVGMDL